MNIIDIIADQTGMTRGDCRRFVEQGAVKVDGATVRSRHENVRRDSVVEIVNREPFIARPVIAQKPA